MVGIEFVVVIVLIILNGVLAVSELSIVSARPARMQARIDAGSSAAKTAMELAEHPGKFLGTVQVGITLIGIINGAFGGATLSEPFAKLLRDLPLIGSHASGVSQIVVVLVITYLSVVIGELVPKQLALQNAETYATMMAPTMSLISRLAAPVVWFLSASSNFVLRVFRAQASGEPDVTEDEVRTLLVQATDAGIFARAEQELVAGIFGIGDRSVNELMTPRHQMIALDLAEPESINIQRMKESAYDVYPVVEGSPDNVVGIVNTRDLWHRHLDGEPIDIAGAKLPAVFVPEISPVLVALRQMRDANQQMAIVIDEYGGVEGLITTQDVLSDVVEQMGSHEGPQEMEGVVQRDDGSWLVDGQLGAHDARSLLRLDALEGEEEGHFETIAGFLLDQLGHIPRAGETVDSQGYRFEVMDMDGHRIDKILIHSIPA